MDGVVVVVVFVYLKVTINECYLLLLYFNRLFCFRYRSKNFFIQEHVRILKEWEI